MREISTQPPSVKWGLEARKAYADASEKMTEILNEMQTVRKHVSDCAGILWNYPTSDALSSIVSDINGVIEEIEYQQKMAQDELEWIKERILNEEDA